MRNSIRRPIKERFILFQWLRTAFVNFLLIWSLGAVFTLLVSFWGERQFSYHFRQRARAAELGTLNIERDFSDVRDITEYRLTVAKTGGSYDIINLRSGRWTSLTSMLELAKKRSRHEIKIIASPRLVREQETFWQVGDRAGVNEITSRSPCFSVGDTIEWMLRHN